MPILAQEFGAFRAADLLLPGMAGKRAEIIEGELIVMSPAEHYHNRIATEFLFLFREFCRTRPDLDYGNDNEGFLIRRDPDTLLSPDACLLRRRPAGAGPWMEFAPEIAVEVLSPSNSRAEMIHKIGEYLGAGGEQVWVADPETRTLDIYIRGGRRLTAQGDETIAGEGIAEGMQIRLAEILRKP